MSKARMAAGSYFQTGDGTTAVGASAVFSIPAATGATAGTAHYTLPWGFNSSVQSNAGSDLPILFSATSASLQTIVNALFNVGVNGAGQPNLLVAGGPLSSTAITLTAQNDLANKPLVAPILNTVTSTIVGGTAVAATITTPGLGSGETFSSISELTTLPFPQVKRAKKEVTNFDSINFTKEFIPEFIDPGDVRMDANYVGDSSQDYMTGLLAKFNQGLIYTCRINIPHYVVGPSVYSIGHLETFKGFFTDASLAPAKVVDTLTISGTLGITGAVAYSKPL